MTRPKISDEQAQQLLDVVRYTLDFHEWCEMPRVKDPRCGEMHYQNCAEDPCSGCREESVARKAAKWERKESSSCDRP